MMFWRAAALFLVFGASMSDAFAQSDACNDSYVAAQKLRLAGDLIEAQTALTSCLADTCAEYQRTDCARWIDEVERELPTVVFRVTDRARQERTDVKVMVSSAGGEPRLLAERLDGRPLPVNPGSHTFTLSWPGQEPAELSVTLVVGEKNRKLVVDRSPPRDPPPQIEPRPPVEGGFHPAAWVLGGIGLVGFGVFAGAGLYSISLEDCAPLCSDDQKADVITARIAADVALTVGAATLATGVIVAIATFESGNSEVVITTDGRGLSVVGRF
jgi:hypothetical protein